MNVDDFADRMIEIVELHEMLMNAALAFNMATGITVGFASDGVTFEKGYSHDKEDEEN